MNLRVLWLALAATVLAFGARASEVLTLDPPDEIYAEFPAGYWRNTGFSNYGWWSEGGGARFADLTSDAFSGYVVVHDAKRLGSRSMSSVDITFAYQPSGAVADGDSAIVEIQIAARDTDGSEDNNDSDTATTISLLGPLSSQKIYEVTISDVDLGAYPLTSSTWLMYVEIRRRGDTDNFGRDLIVFPGYLRFY